MAKDSSKITFLKKTLENLPLPEEGKRDYYWDTVVRGLSLDVTSTGLKTFYYRRTVAYKRQQVLIGRFPEVTIEQARAKAHEIAGSIGRGEDPTEAKRVQRQEPTLGDLLDEYIEGHAKHHCVAWQEIAAVFRRYLSDWTDRKLTSIKPSHAQARINDIGCENGHVAANHTLTYAKAAINWCIKNGLTRSSNPWIGIKKFKTQPRERFLLPDELERFFKALQELSNENGIRDYVYLSLLTGARQANVLSMRWDQIDFTLGIWRIPRVKSGESQMLPLTSLALGVLHRRRQEPESSSEWVFPGDGKTGHLVEPKKGWYSLLKSANLDNLRMHDLRRTLGSYMAMGNQSLHLIGRVLGHKSPSATQIYSKLTYDPLRAAMEKAQFDMLTTAGLLPHERTESP